MSTPVLRKDRENGTGRWYAYYTVGGRSKRKSMGTADRAVAEERFIEWMRVGGHKPVDEAVAQRTETMVVSDLWKKYDKHHVQEKTAAPASILYAWKNLESHFGHLKLAQIDQVVVDRYVDARRKGKIGRASKSSTVRKELSMLRSCINWCAKPNRKIVSPAEMPVFDLPPESLPRDRWLRMGEMQDLLDAAARMRRGDRLSRGERFLWIALEAPARKTAILELTWNRVDFDTNTIHFDIEGRQQTKKRRAAVAMSKGLRKIMERAYAEKIGPLVMDNTSEIWATVQWTVIEAGLSDQKRPKKSEKPKATGISPHTLRHTAATHMARNGVPLWKIAKILGNTLAMVERVYAKWAPEDPEGTVDLISNGKLEAAE